VTEEHSREAVSKRYHSSDWVLVSNTASPGRDKGRTVRRRTRPVLLLDLSPGHWPLASLILRGDTMGQPTVTTEGVHLERLIIHLDKGRAGRLRTGWLVMGAR